MPRTPRPLTPRHSPVPRPRATVPASQPAGSPLAASRALGAPATRQLRRAARARLLAQVAYVALADAEAIEDCYAWPPRAPLSADELDELDHLRGLSAELFRLAERDGWSGGTDAAFGGES